MSNWTDIRDQLVKIGLPLLGAALPVPGGAALGAALASHIGAKDSSPSSILSALTQSVDAVQKAKEFEATHQERMLDMAQKYEIAQRQADSADIASVNATMQAEAANSANENWFQKGWRPFNGYVLGVASLIAVIFVCVLFYNSTNLPATCAQIPALAAAIAMILTPCGAAAGITAWHRGVVQRIQADNG